MLNPNLLILPVKLQFLVTTDVHHFRVHNLCPFDYLVGHEKEEAEDDTYNRPRSELIEFSSREDIFVLK